MKFENAQDLYKFYLKGEAFYTSSDVAVDTEASVCLILRQKVILSPTCFMFIFEYSEHQRVHFETHLFAHYLFKGNFETPSVPGHWNQDTITEDTAVQRKYTPVFVDQPNRLVHFLIRIYRPNSQYPDGGKLTRFLDKLPIDSDISVHPFSPRVKLIQEQTIKVLSNVLDFSVLNIVAGGTGITPFVRYLLAPQSAKVSVNLLFCNRTLEEIVLRDCLDKIAERENTRVFHVATSDIVKNDLSVSYGKIDSGILIKSLVNSSEAVTLVCGPPGMCTHVMELLKLQKFDRVYKI
ncbi:bifunctional Oxidoreductase FAD-NAD(P)-binding/Flavoprotein pyridine nucleotide cytochrome reductase-like [Babesia duncani]|uniref:Bifunctional Oxidoreductase FAD-NAD(P)-binding/Flavoprotein pyridine nucleotide cytochrome reductase-like n=1 Tax=Babesia duncani TaxID=323732 RepID=A0AAD9PIS0_9APIC|nr:bifunctional Oxidoreductase FAD-NAD(P)-binding/Flavoprotein pyridine nucleotide cytochrome reductase-like [Babesia duncani]